MLQKISLIFITMFSFVQAALVYADLQQDILPVATGSWVLSGVSEGEDILDAVLRYVRDSIFGLMALIAIGVFLYIGFKLISARWNPEEFKKALNTLIYAVIGIFVVSFAWAAVRLVAGLNI